MRPRLAAEAAVDEVISHDDTEDWHAKTYDEHAEENAAQPGGQPHLLRDQEAQDVLWHVREGETPTLLQDTSGETGAVFMNDILLVDGEMLVTSNWCRVE